MNKISKMAKAPEQNPAVPEVEKKANPKVFQSLENYEKLKQQLYDHFFEGKALSIDNKKFSFAYS